MTRLAFVFLLVASAVSAVADGLPVLPLGDHATWQAVGRINAAGFRKREMCSGTLIAPNKVLTAAHCLAGTNGLGPRPEEFTFVAGWLQGQAVDSVSGSEIWVHPKAYAQGVLDIRYDIALLTLARPAQIAPLQTAQTPPRPPFGALGYSTRRPHMLGASFACQGVMSSNLLRLDCPVTAGNSGGPVVAKAGQTWEIVAVISAMGRSGALAVPVSRLSAP